jgi:cytochrome c peroxidase
MNPSVLAISLVIASLLGSGLPSPAPQARSIPPQDEKQDETKKPAAKKDGEKAKPEAKLELPEFVTYAIPDSLPDPDHPGMAAPTSKLRKELGEKLFFDPLLSGDKTVSCATCHKPEFGFADNKAFSEGVRGQKTHRNTPSLLNRYLGSAFMWDARFETLEQQVLDPINNKEEMDLGTDKALARLAEHAEYPKLFAAAWPGKKLDAETLAGSLAHFIRHIRLGDSPVDVFRYGDASPLNAKEKRGLWLYESRAQCWRCHFGPDFTDEVAHNTGIGVKDGKPEEGRFAITKNEEDQGKFKTPTLRGLVYTAPYMHDGSLKTLREVVEHYRKGGVANSHLSPDIKKLHLSDADAEALVAFLEALSRTK